MNNKYKNLIILGIILLTYVLIISVLGYQYGSMVDWISQHFRIPEYFRNLFYQTKNLFPDFALNLGSGQNIYYLSYYGLYNPIILISYLFPFIKMMDYIIISYIILILTSTYLIYYWLNNKFSSKVAFIGSITFLLASPLIYHSHRHLMFINYMPFLILALIGIDNYFKNNKRVLLIISCSLIIFSSYYFSIPSLIIITIYAINTYLNTNRNISLKMFLNTSLKFFLTMIIPILLSSILIVPTIYTLINGRNPTSININILNTIIPKFNSNAILYYTYGLGLTAFSIIAIINNIFSKNTKYRFITICILIILFIPFFIYLLNGFMYIDGKVLIPFLPILCLLISNTFNNIFKKNINYKKLLTLSTILVIIIILNNLNFKFNLLFIIDYIIMFISLIIYNNKKSKYFILIPYIIILTINFISFNIPKEKLYNINSSSDQFVEDSYVKINEKTNEKDLIEIINNDQGFYRVNNLNNILYNVNNILDDNYYATSIYSSSSNSYYTNFIRNIFKNEIYNKDYATITESNNVLFNIYMGNKYLLSDYSLLGYKLVKEGKYTNLYQNDNAYSIGYASNKKISIDEFNTLKYPYTMDALLNYVIVNDKENSKYNENISKINTIHDKLSFDVKDELEYDIPLDNKINNEILIISFDMLYNETCDVSNQSITINNIVNTLSCRSWKYHNKNYKFNYVISSNEIIDKLHIKINKGHYEIDNINIYKMDYNAIINNSFDKFIVDTNNINGNEIKGTINVTNDNSYFILNIPYDKGFNIKVDGINKDYELANTSFIGFNIESGTHEIIITFNAPYKILGLILSGIGLIILILIIIIEKRGIRWKRSKNLF